MAKKNIDSEEIEEETISLGDTKKQEKYERLFKNRFNAFSNKELINAYHTHCTSASGVAVTIYRRMLITTLEERFDISALEHRYSDGTIGFSFGKSIMLVGGTIKIL